MSSQPLRTTFTDEADLRAYVANTGELVVAAGKAIRATPALLESFVASIPWGNLSDRTMADAARLIAVSQERRRPIPDEVEGWRIAEWSARGSLIDFTIERTDGLTLAVEREAFESCDFGGNLARALEWGAEQAAARAAMRQAARGEG